MTALAAGELRQKFEDAVNRNDFPAFNDTYRKFLSEYPAFNKALSATPTELAAYSAIFGRTGFFLKQTNDAEAKDLLTSGRAASKVFDKLSIAERLGFLKVLQAKIKLHEQEIALVISADTGKPVELSDKEMAKGAEWFDFAAKEAEAQVGPKGDDAFKTLSRPLGVAQVIGAYNYPYALAIGGIVGGLVAGNGVIISAPLKAPNWVFPFMAAVKEAVEDFSAQAKTEGKPWADAFAANASGLVQYSVGVNRMLTAEADLVHFVGGDVTGNIIRKSRGNKPTILEMGGSNVAVVMESVLGVETAADVSKKIYDGFVPATGQRCTAPRMLCAETGAEAVVEALGKLIAEGDHKIGNTFSKGTKMGPLVDRGAHQKMVEAIALAEELGATVYGSLKVNSNEIPQAVNENSFWVKPVMIDWGKIDFTDAKKAERIQAVLKEEIFGPLLHVLPRVNGLDAAIATTNTYDSHGLAGAIFTGNKEDAERYATGVRVTSITVNDGPKDRSPHGPHGHPGLAPIGGRHHFNLYASETVIAAPKPKPAAEQKPAAAAAAPLKPAA